MTGLKKFITECLALATAAAGFAAEQLPLKLAQSVGQAGFRLVDAKQSGATFRNELSVAAAAENQVLLNGSGVAAGDFDRDGLPDLYFCGLKNDNVLYRNLGDFRFEPAGGEAVSCAGVPSTSSAFADLNGDGHLDLLVGTLGQGVIVLMNDTRGGFSKSTVALPEGDSLAIYSSPMTDIDRDGDLDVYLATYRSTSIRNNPGLKFKLGYANNVQTLESVTDSKTGTQYDNGRFYIRDGEVLEAGTPDYQLLNDGTGKFRVTTLAQFQANSRGDEVVTARNWGLGSIFADFDNDHRDDLYVCNDLDGADYFYRSTANGFDDVISGLNNMTSAFSMGVDVADINNDGLSDFIVVDMMNYSLPERKMQIPHSTPAPGHPSAISEYRRNTLFVGAGGAEFDEIAHYSGLDSSDWSWCPIFMDVDLDGYQDLLVTNGFSYDLENPDVQNDLMKLSIQTGGRGDLVEKTFKIEHSKLDQNLSFRNRGDLTFRDRSADWGFNLDGISHGACLADLDNDGDQDVVLNNFSLYLQGRQLLGESLPRLQQSNPVCTIYENLTSSDRIKVRVRSEAKNTHGIGATLVFIQDSVRQTKQIRAGSRYCSSDSPEVTFAWLADKSSRRLEYRLGSKVAFIEGVKRNSLITFSEDDLAEETPVLKTFDTTLFEEQPVRSSFRHSPNQLNAEHFQPGISRNHFLTEPIVSAAGNDPAVVRISTGGSVQGVSLQDSPAATNRPVRRSRWDLADFTHLTVGRKLMRLELQRQLGRTQQFESRLFVTEDVLSPRAATWAHTLPGNFTCLCVTQLPGQPGTAAVALGGGTRLGHYPLAANTLVLGLRLAKPGERPRILHKLPFKLPVNDMQFADMDGRLGQELVIAPEGGEIAVYQLTGQKAGDITRALGIQSGTGNWNSVACFDFSGNGRNDLLAGNWGDNSSLNRYVRNHYRLYFQKNDESTRLYETFRHNGKNVLMPGLAKFKKHNPIRGLMYRTHNAFKLVGAEDIFETPPEHRTVDTLRTRLFLNDNGAFKPLRLPEAVQFAPTFGIAVEDFDLDGSLDIALCQGFTEFYGDTEPQANNSHLLLINRLATGGSFEVRRNSGIERNNTHPRVISSGDFDGDNRPDLIIPSYGAGVRHYKNITPGEGIKLQLTGDSLKLIGLKARLRYRDGSQGPLYEYTPKYGYRKEAANHFIFGIRAPVEAIEIIGLGELPVVPGQVAYTLPQLDKKTGQP
ncbi:MAG: hypothetical protein CL923_00010 [Deltaproteobacteria bacterium]|nr:hypothetical protein [Deltaproteobacteria bacterium]